MSTRGNRSIKDIVLTREVTCVNTAKEQLKAEQNLADRKREAKKCFHLIERHVQRFEPWVEHSPASGANCFVPELAAN